MRLTYYYIFQIIYSIYPVINKDHLKAFLWDKIHDKGVKVIAFFYQKVYLFFKIKVFQNPMIYLTLNQELDNLAPDQKVSNHYE